MSDQHTQALLVIDLQRYFLEPGEPAFFPVPSALIPNISALIETFRQSGDQIIFTRHAHQRGTPEGQMQRFWKGHLPWEGERPAELIDAIAPRQDELIITKDRYSAFEGTGLEEHLHTRGVQTIILCGVMTNLCVETTARHAFLKDFTPIIIEDACAAKAEAYHRASLLNLSYGFAHVLSTESFLAARHTPAALEGRSP